MKAKYYSDVKTFVVMDDDGIIKFAGKIKSMTREYGQAIVDILLEKGFINNLEEDGKPDGGDKL